jgi:Cys-rich repeat protein
VEGTCVDGAPPPSSCNSDADCGTGAACVDVTVCGTCPDGSGSGGGGSGGGGNGDQPAPPPPTCDSSCVDEPLCVQTQPVCFDDSQCGAGDFCDFNQLPCNDPGSGVAAHCPGVCEPLAAPTVCRVDADCGSGQRCATELAAPVCVDDSQNSGAFCLEDSECGAANESCRFDADVCLQDPNNSTPVCSGWCVGICADHTTPARDPATGQCVVFADSCIPPGWQPVASCP